MIIDKALYGLQTSGNAWHEKFADNLRSLGFQTSKADTDLWVKYLEDENTYDFVAVFVDDILVFSKKPETVIEPLKEKFKYELKGVGEPEYYNGADITRSPISNCWEFSAKISNKNITDKIEKLFGIHLKNYGAPMEVGNHSELNESNFVSPDQISQY